MKYGKYLISHPWPAGMVAMLFSAIPFFGWISLIITGLVTLCRGPRFGLWMMLCASIPSLMVGVTHSPELILTNVIGGCFYMWLSATVFWYATSWTLVLEVTLVLALAGIAIVHILYPDIMTWWINKYQSLLVALQHSLEETISQVVAETTDIDNVNQFITALSNRDILQTVAKISTGITFSAILLGNLTNLLLARWWQFIVNAEQGKGTWVSFKSAVSELSHIRIGYVSMAVFILTFVGINLQINTAWDFIPIFCAIFFCAGLSMLQFFVGRLKNAMFYIVVFCLVLLFFPMYVATTVIFVAMLDTLFNLRARFSRTLN